MEYIFFLKYLVRKTTLTIILTQISDMKYNLTEISGKKTTFTDILTEISY